MVGFGSGLARVSCWLELFNEKSIRHYTTVTRVSYIKDVDSFKLAEECKNRSVATFNQ